MKKWGIRLISFYFIAWAILIVIRVFLSPGNAGGFFGIYTDYSFEMYPFKSINQIDFGAWGEFCVLLIVGYHLFHCNSTARLTALIILCPSAIWNGFFLLLTLISLTFFSRSSTNTSMTFHLVNNIWKIEGVSVSLFAVGNFLLKAMPLYFLMRKDVKMEFQKQEMPTPKPVTE